MSFGRLLPRNRMEFGHAPAYTGNVDGSFGGPRLLSGHVRRSRRPPVRSVAYLIPTLPASSGWNTTTRTTIGTPIGIGTEAITGGTTTTDRLILTSGCV